MYHQDRERSRLGHEFLDLMIRVFFLFPKETWLPVLKKWHADAMNRFEFEVFVNN